MPYNVDIPGFMSIPDLEVLEQLAQQVPAKGIIVEIGSFMGRSSWTLAKSCDSSVQVHCVDPWPKYTLTDEDLESMAGYTEGLKLEFSTFKKNVQDCPNITAIEGCSTEVEWPEDKLIDLLFIDGDHESPGVENDMECWFKRLKPEGILVGHDFNLASFPDVCRAVISKAEKENLAFKLFESSAIWLIEKDSDLFKHLGWTPNEETIDKIKRILYG
ncbi:MAG: putative O-methyltransferase YrrM [Chlamydiales bacterium]|jgi:predicted O-methyltransferase YrrM